MLPATLTSLLVAFTHIFSTNSLDKIERPSHALQFQLRHLHAVSDSAHVVFSDVQPRTLDAHSNDQGPFSDLYTIRSRKISSFRPPSFQAFSNARIRSIRFGQSEHLQWNEEEIVGPDVERRETLLELAKMTNNAYLVPGEAGCPESNIWIIGHSLGGALASLLGATFGAPVVTFESPGERMAARRLHLPSPPSTHHITHVYHSADPIAMGTCNGVLSSCALAGYAMESRCHLGKTIFYDTVTNLSWTVDIRTHGIVNVIEKLLSDAWAPSVEVGREVPEPQAEDDCVLPPGLAKISHDEVVLIELQGALEVEGNHPSERDGKLVGKLTVDTVTNKSTLLIGHHLLEGKITNLAKPLAILLRSRTASTTTVSGTGVMDVEMFIHNDDEETHNAVDMKQVEWDMVALVKRKIVFSKRPMPIVNARTT
ncbi:hypothetical protein C0991_009977 [Blastosporella zonata]|nr:hypothetical protein C0991_009977 [Blastosporella zonata]